MTKAQWIIDTDLRTDVVAVLKLALGQRKASLAGITLVQWREHDPDYRITKELAELLPEGVGIYPGVNRSFLRPMGQAVSSFPLAAPRQIRDPAGAQGMPHAVDYLAQVLDKAKEPVDVLCLGPLTNLALFIRTRPDLTARIGRVIVRGGCFFRGDVTAAAERNIYRDPEAAHIVFQAGLDLSMVSLEAAEEAGLTRGEAALFHGGAHYGGADSSGQRGGIPDPVERDVTEGLDVSSALTLLFRETPELFYTEYHNVSIDLQGELTRGSTVVDFSDQMGKKPNCQVVRGIACDDGARRWRTLLFEGQ